MAPQIILADAAFDPDGAIDPRALRLYRKGRVRSALARSDLAGIVLFNPINIRYASDARNMQVYSLHNPCRYLFLAADGHTVLFDFRNCEHLSKHLETIDEIRPAKPFYYMATGSQSREAAQRWAAELAELLRRHGGNRSRIAFDVLDPAGAAALEAEGLGPGGGPRPMAEGPAVQFPERVQAVRAGDPRLRGGPGRGA